MSSDSADTSKIDSFVSIVLVSSELQSWEDVQRVEQYLNGHFVDYEILIVNDTLNRGIKLQLNELLSVVPSVRFLELAYEVEYERALLAGLENSIGDFVIIFSIPQDPLDMIQNMVSICIENKVHVVVGITDNIKKSIGYRLVRPFISMILKEIGYRIPRDATSLRCLSRTAVNAATRSGSSHHQIFTRIAECGYETVQTKYSTLRTINKYLLNSLKIALKIAVFNSTKPLRWMSVLGVFGCLSAFLVATYSFVVRLISHNIAHGWSSIVMFVSFLFIVLFVILSFFGEYLGRLLNDRSLHDPYWITDERSSSIMLNKDRNNVSEDSGLPRIN